jgi:hypothetical protein
MLEEMDGVYRMLLTSTGSLVSRFITLSGYSICSSHLCILPRVCDIPVKSNTIVRLTIEPKCNIYCLCSVSLRFWGVQNMGVMNKKSPTAIKDTMKHQQASLAQRCSLVQ